MFGDQPATPPSVERRRKLGPVQQKVLRALRKHRTWSRGCGWYWDTYKNTQRIMDSLVAAGWVERIDSQVGSNPTYVPKGAE